MGGKEIAVKKYVVRLSADEREKLASFIGSGKRSAQLLTKARILLKADVSDEGEGWSDSRIAEALDTSVANVERTRRQLVEEGFEAALTRKYNPSSARPRIFDGARRLLLNKRMPSLYRQCRMRIEHKSSRASHLLPHLASAPRLYCTTPGTRVFVTGQVQLSPSHA